jgi:hypothetical protein
MRRTSYVAQRPESVRQEVKQACSGDWHNATGGAVSEPDEPVRVPDRPGWPATQNTTCARKRARTCLSWGPRFGVRLLAQPKEARHG